jgi:ABC-type nickel/cobalt efflux system permease component RcnA
MTDAGRLSTAALVASTAAISCALTGLAAAYVLSKYLQPQQQHAEKQKSYQQQQLEHLSWQVNCDDGPSPAYEAAVHARASCATPEPTLPGVADHQHDQMQQHQQHHQQLCQLQQQQQQVLRQQPAAAAADVALFSPVNAQKRPDPYDVRPRHT